MTVIYVGVLKELKLKLKFVLSFYIFADPRLKSCCKTKLGLDRNGNAFEWFCMHFAMESIYICCGEFGIMSQ